MKTTYIKQVVASLLLAGGILPSTASAQTTAALLPMAYTIDYIMYWAIGVPFSLIVVWCFWRYVLRNLFIKQLPPVPPETIVGPLPVNPDVYMFQTPQGVFPVRYADIAGGHIITVGRSRSCTLQLADGQVSMHHGIISVVNGVLSFTDTGSTNGTYINGHRIPVNQPYPIQRGTCIRVGNRVNVNVM